MKIYLEWVQFNSSHDDTIVSSEYCYCCFLNLPFFFFIFQLAWAQKKKKNIENLFHNMQTVKGNKGETGKCASWKHKGWCLAHSTCMSSRTKSHIPHASSLLYKINKCTCDGQWKRNKCCPFKTEEVLAFSPYGNLAAVL